MGDKWEIAGRSRWKGKRERERMKEEEKGKKTDLKLSQFSMVCVLSGVCLMAHLILV